MRVFTIFIAALFFNLTAGFMPRPSLIVGRTTLNVKRGPAKEDDCAIRNSGLVPSKTPIIFGGLEKDRSETVKQKILIGHIIPAVIGVACVVPALIN
mmetsp:Transcript_24206/g.33122  ORF Transcript_24206/g.33122 Transcript_24206/m.33122 type:complete len:97 (+) Transcript_24206:73-363(+)|eukprot:CAMPEP_0185770162 /NCGR_PEP_ID=MMETSP1174-20130828/57771_1 /TAXON_ID=35687 /ORGANISM="Dictyocha speculum, Strain CCMP1381" /LENGTH=96 /DNA_ID=CAMNT_0028455487 /DNA_START=69 /DNA_END=359 /DNA_ORIENTATION=+